MIEMIIKIEHPIYQHYHSLIGSCDCILSMTKRKSNFKEWDSISFIEFHNQINVYYIKNEY
jgi:hypothetical protein